MYLVKVWSKLIIHQQPLFLDIHGKHRHGQVQGQTQDQGSQNNAQLFEMPLGINISMHSSQYLDIF